MKGNIKNHLLPLLSIIATVLFVWHKLFDQAILGEGYYYFAPEQNFFGRGGIPNENHSYFANIIFDILPAIFQDNQRLYFGFQVLVVIILASVLYFTVQQVTKNKVIGSLAAIIFSTGYTTTYEMMAIGNYQRFVQRVPNLFFLILSIYFLYKYLEGKKFKHLFIALLLFTLGMFLAHFSTFLLPFFVLSPVIYYSVTTPLKKIHLKNLLFSVMLSGAFILITFILISNDSFKNESNLFEFFQSRKDILPQVLSQFVNISLPQYVTTYIAKLFDVRYPYKSLIPWLSVSVITFYLTGLILIYRRHKRLLPLYISGLLSLPLIFILNLMSNRVDAVSNFGQDRYYYYPSVIVTILVSLLIFSVVKTKKGLALITIVFLIFFLPYNYSEINKNISSNQYKSVAMNRYLNHIKTISPNFSDKTIIVIPSSLMWPEAMIKYVYGNQNIKFIAFQDGWEKSIPNDKINDTFVIDYDYARAQGGDVDFIKARIIDLTDKFRSGEKINFIP